MSRPHPFRVATALSALALLVMIASPAHAQGGMGGVGGMGRGGGREGEGRRPGMGRGAAGRDVARRFEEMGSLKDVLKHVDGLGKAQKDSLKRLEKHYTESFEGYGKQAKTMFAAADSGARPDMEEMRRLRDDALNLRRQELADARAGLATDAQRAAFDANVQRLEEERAKREEGMRERRRAP